MRTVEFTFEIFREFGVALDLLTGIDGNVILPLDHIFSCKLFLRSVGL